MRPEIDLILLRDGLVQLTKSTYFGAELHKFTAMLVGVIDHVTNNSQSYAEPIIRAFEYNISQTFQYLSGALLKQAPYEMSYCLEQAVKPWTSRDIVITTGLTYGQDFHFHPNDPWNFIKLNITGFNTNSYDPRLIFIGVPRLYIHKPIYCIPLFHELGHFVDITYGISNRSLLLAPALPYSTMSVFPVISRHRMEHFADLFAACYVGRSSIETLLTLAPGGPASTTHPATDERVRLVDDFLSGSPSVLVDLFQSALASLGVPPLARQFSAPEVSASFDDIRPYEIRDTRELFGLFESGWIYLAGVLDHKQSPWASSTTKLRSEKIINDLVENSIRSFAIVERWNRGTP